MTMGLVQSSSPAVCKSTIWFGKYLTTRLRENEVKHRIPGDDFIPDENDASKARVEESSPWFRGCYQGKTSLGTCSDEVDHADLIISAGHV